jgi:HAMP domain-containing protein
LNLPRIESLTFQISSDPHTRYEHPEQMAFANALGQFQTGDGMLVWWPDEDFFDIEEAKRAVASFLSDWEVHAAIQGMPEALRFRFDHTEFEPLISRGPGETVVLAAAAAFAVSAVASAIVIRKRYPAPPLDFHATTEVETAFRRWRAYLEGREPLLSMAYFVFTVLVPENGRSRQEASALFAIEETVLRTLSGLSSVRSGLDARKFTASNPVPLSDHERAWLEDAVRRLIYRLGEHAGGAALTLIQMDDLPQPPPVVGPKK